MLLARQGDQTSLLRLNTAALDLAEFDIAGPQAHPLQFFVFGPRDLYRPDRTPTASARSAPRLPVPANTDKSPKHRAPRQTFRFSDIKRLVISSNILSSTLCSRGTKPESFLKSDSFLIYVFRIAMKLARLAGIGGFVFVELIIWPMMLANISRVEDAFLSPSRKK